MLFTGDLPAMQFRRRQKGRAARQAWEEWEADDRAHSAIMGTIAADAETLLDLTGNLDTVTADKRLPKERASTFLHHAMINSAAGPDSAPMRYDTRAVTEMGLYLNSDVDGGALSDTDTGVHTCTHGHRDSDNARVSMDGGSDLRSDREKESAEWPIPNGKRTGAWKVMAQARVQGVPVSLLSVPEAYVRDQLLLWVPKMVPPHPHVCRVYGAALHRCDREPHQCASQSLHLPCISTHTGIL